MPTNTVRPHMKFAYYLIFYFFILIKNYKLNGGTKSTFSALMGCVMRNVAKVTSLLFKQAKKG